MKTSYFRKVLVLVILILFIGASVYANECDCEKTNEKNVNKNLEFNPNDNIAEKYSIEQLCGLVEPEDWYVNAPFDP